MNVMGWGDRRRNIVKIRLLDTLKYARVAVYPSARPSVRSFASWKCNVNMYIQVSMHPIAKYVRPSARLFPHAKPLPKGRWRCWIIHSNAHTECFFASFLSVELYFDLRLLELDWIGSDLQF